MLLNNLFLINMNSLFAILFWGNAISLLFLIIYQYQNKFLKERKTLLFLIIARLCHAIYYCVATGRGVIPDLISVNIGISLLLIGFYFEAQAILRIIKENSRFADRLLAATLTFFVLLFNVVEAFAPYGGIRIAVASIGNVAIMSLPVARMLVSRDASVYTKPTGILYAIFLLMLFGRAYFGIQYQDQGILTTNILHSVTFLALLLQLIIALPSYILIIKSYADDALLLMATTDRLTGATNRHAFQDAASAISKNCLRSRLPLSVLFLDIDRFKMVNDRYGHAFGDLVLARLSVLIDKCLRDSDLSCRYGGEEFIMLLANSNLATAKQVAERIMSEVRQARFADHPDFLFTVSIGIYSAVPESEHSFDEAVVAADKAMYRAKQAGRNRVEVA